MSVFNTNQYGIDWKHTDFTEKTYSGVDDDSKKRAFHKSAVTAVTNNTAIKCKNTKLRPVNRFF
jgi:hypothetical protein